LSPLLRSFAAALAPSFFVITGGNSNCITYDTFGADLAPERQRDSRTEVAPRKPQYMSDYCKEKEYYGHLQKDLWNLLLDFGAEASADFVWHLNMAFGRGYSKQYTLWDRSPAMSLLNYTAFRLPLAGAMLFEEVKNSKVGFHITSQDLGKDLKEMRKALVSAGGPLPLVYGVMNQDSDQSPAGTDKDYAASAADVDVVCFSYYMNNAALHKACPVDPQETATFLLDANHRASLDKTVKHFANLSAHLGKEGPHLIGAAPCTHAPEGTGWGAVNAHAGSLWYADALGRAAANGAAVFARQTLFGGSYGLLDNTTYMPTPGYWAALLHKRIMGQTVLDTTTITDMSATTVYSHCAEAGGAKLAVLVVNMDKAAVPLELPEHTQREEWIVEADSLLSTIVRLNGQELKAGADGSLPSLDGKTVDGHVAVAIPGHSILFAVLSGTVTGTQECKDAEIAI